MDTRLNKPLPPNGLQSQSVSSRQSGNFLAGLVVGGRDMVSLGRVAFWLILGLCVWFWLARPSADFPPTLGEALWAVLAYNFGGKAVNNFREPLKMRQSLVERERSPDS